MIAERYHVLKRLGEGGDGAGLPRRACEDAPAVRAIMKVMNAALVNDTASAARFAQREASSAARILHPNVAAVFDYGEANDIVYIVMEYVDGEPLTALIEREGRLAPHRALGFARQIVDGLAAAHELGLVHRDLKPDNILVAHGAGGREIVKIVDFGIAKTTAESSQEGLTRTGYVVGTPEFMSPEQLLGDPVDARSDIYSLGCILFIMLTGQPAFSAKSREQMIKRRLSEPPPHPNVLVPELHSTFDSLVVRLLERAPAARFASTAEVREALSQTVTNTTTTPPAPYRPTPRSIPTPRWRDRRECGAIAAKEMAVDPTGHDRDRRGSAPAAGDRAGHAHTPGTGTRCRSGFHAHHGRRIAGGKRGRADGRFARGKKACGRRTRGLRSGKGWCSRR